MNIRPIWGSKLQSYTHLDFFSGIELDKLDEVIGVQLLADQTSLEQWRQTMYLMNNKSNIPSM